VCQSTQTKFILDKQDVRVVPLPLVLNLLLRGQKGFLNRSGREKEVDEMRQTVLILVIVALVAWAAPAMSFQTQGNVPVSATVLGMCTISGGSIAFGNLTSAAHPVVVGVVTQPTINCTNGLSYTITDDAGANDIAGAPQMTDGSGNLIPYTFTYNAGPLVGSGVDETPMNLAAQVPANGAQSKPAGAYSDTIVFTITY
jgi:spore coat protein U-like protein